MQAVLDQLLGHFRMATLNRKASSKCVRDQEKHHARKSFRQEYLQFLKKYVK